MIADSNSVCGRKRGRGHLEAATSDHPASKKRDCSCRHRGLWKPSSRFWDTLSKAHLTRLGLREFDCRVKDRKELRHPPSQSALQIKSCPLTRGTVRRRRDLAEDGGPDLSHLRGFATRSATMSSYSRRRNGSSASGRPSASKTPKSSAYNWDFEQKLMDAGVFLNDIASEPTNLQDVQGRLVARRASLSPSRFDDQEFKEFRKLAQRSSRGEPNVMRDLIPIIEGAGQKHQHHSLYDIPFVRVQPFAEEIADARPDLFDGASQQQLNSLVRTDLSSLIVPTCGVGDPVAPNFFLEAKSAQGRGDIAQRQAGHDGAIGARGMHALQNYGRDEPVYDGKAYSFSSIYHASTGTLEMFAHHPTAPRQRGGDPEYHMTRLKVTSFGDGDDFRRGAGAYRNLREYAKEQRDLFIDQANQRASNMPTSPVSSRGASMRSIRIASPAEDSDTSQDELALSQTTVKPVQDQVRVKRTRPNQTKERRVRSRKDL